VSVEDRRPQPVQHGNIREDFLSFGGTVRGGLFHWRTRVFQNVAVTEDSSAHPPPHSSSWDSRWGGD